MENVLTFYKDQVKGGVLPKMAHQKMMTMFTDELTKLPEVVTFNIIYRPGPLTHLHPPSPTTQDNVSALYHGNKPVLMEIYPCKWKDLQTNPVIPASSSHSPTLTHSPTHSLGYVAL